MEDTSEDTEIGSSSKRKSYPIKELSYILNFVAKIYTDLGANLYHSGEDIARINDLKVESIKQILSTCRQYNLLEIKHGTGYKVSPLFIKIYKPLTEKEKLEGIIESLRSCEIFSKLIEDYNGHNVPPLNSVANNIARSGFAENVAQKVADVFINNLKDFNLINSHNQLNLVINADADSKPKVKDGKGDENGDTPKPEVPNSQITIIPIPLKSSGKKAFLHIPDGFTNEDLERISKFVEALK